MAEIETLLDVQGLNCPMPLLKAKRALNGLKTDDLLRVLATDPGSERDFAVFARQSGNTLLESTESDGVYCFLLKKQSKER
jgi:tRNA 2-thiouridine synthesizing protein A